VDARSDGRGVDASSDGGSSVDSSHDSSTNLPPDGATVDALGDASRDAPPDSRGEASVYDPASLVALPCNDDLSTFWDLPAGLPPFDLSHRGDIVRCAMDQAYSVDDVQAAAAELGYQGPTLQSGARVVRIAYRTLRLADDNGSPVDGISGALVYLPDHPRAGVAPEPLVVAAHGTIGIADICPPSRVGPMQLGNQLDDANSMYLAFVGYGWPVVAPDYAGFNFGATTAWCLAEDEAHALLDSTRAMKNLLVPGALSGKTVLAGHSQGGHAVLSAHSFAASYGLEGDLVGVVGFAPLWINNGSWAAALSPIAGLNTTDDAYTIQYAIDYFYGHGEVIDGAGHGTDMIQSGKAAAVRTMITTMCEDEVANDLPELGSVPTDFFDDTFALEVSTCVLSGVCVGSDQSTWMPRFQADRPAIGADGPPIVIWAGGMDQDVTPGLIECGLDRMNSDLASDTDPTTTITLCADPTAVHSGSIGDPDPSSGITRRGMPWVNEWISARTLGTPAPSPCLGKSGLTPDGGTLTCTTPPPNNN
jgi:hypothetical protein